MCTPLGPQERYSVQGFTIKWSKVVIGAVGAIGALVAVPVTIHTIGFTSQGVAATSLASAWQSTIGNVAAGSVFAGLQSAGK